MSNPIRMCVVCRERFEQRQLIRLQYKDSKLSLFNGQGRSFYICKNCQNTPKLINSIARICKIDKKYKENLKESLKEIFI
ncbi:DUF448 domain-containing protein [Helicobacter canadensis]|uniref:YlxR domain-containing protein n=1 Tax=Helicobacter canadensis MIT 98-5491 TaxID=537970 RepID=C5ZYG9_9HELI|nr:DUF448 domain-containing protein [Helicobacter canadensis]EES90187.1 hypothetical protein HCAN_1482 [Helicobacter canadensis MIT 98-5491]EFR49344.1 hypothetical protein HCMG_01518 [Helicobacter canadensis MIT 98-5491]STP02307.1 Nucleic acid binding transriptional terminator [Helicobacter canadensis]